MQTNVTVVSSATYQNLEIHIIDAVLEFPGTLGDVAMAANLTMLLEAAGEVNLTAPLEAAAGITIFAPTDAAFQSALAALGSAATNVSIIEAILGNHVINGTSLYSPELMSGGMMNLTTASGEPLMVITNSTGVFVMTANSTAMVIQSDVLISNGVVHVIDGVLANAMTNPGAASSAYMSATSVAAAQTGMETGAVGTTPAAASSSAASKSSAAGGKMSLNVDALVGIAVAVGGIVAGGVLVL